MSSGLKGQHAIVTGASRGIGAAVAEALAAAGCNLTLLARGRDTVAEVANDLVQRYGVDAAGIAGDAIDAEAVGRAVRGGTDQHGVPAILINNAGGATSVPFVKESRTHWDETLTANLTSTFIVTQAVLPAMLKEGYGRIVNVASTAGLKGYAYVAAYCAAKHGVIGLTRALALETARKGVTVNAVCPGYTDTPMLAGAIDTIMEKTGMPREQAIESLAAGNPQGRLITPQEVADTVLWLVQPGSASINGQAVAVAGGEVM